MSHTDHAAQRFFLEATTMVFAPPPIQLLSDLVRPAFKLWYAALGSRLLRESKQFASGKIGTFTFKTITTYPELAADRHEGAAGFRRAIIGWMKECRFHKEDEWIGTAAIRTLLASDPGTPVGWFVPFEPWPAASISPLPWESPEEFMARVKVEVVSLARAHRERTGSGKLEPDEHALWTAHRFAGRTFTQIADIAFGRDRVNRGDDAIQKAITRFAKRAGLTLP